MARETDGVCNESTDCAVSYNTTVILYIYIFVINMN